MNKEILILFFFLFLLFSGCEKKNDDGPLDPDDLQLVTGLRVVDFDSEVAFIVGNPCDSKKEIKYRDDGYLGSEVNFVMYPNPVNDYLEVHSSSEITSAWIVPGKTSTDYQAFDFDQYFETNVLDTTGMGAVSVVSSIGMEGVNMLMFDLSDFEKGFYKVILEVEEQRLFWQSIYREDSSDEEEEAPYDVWK